MSFSLPSAAPQFPGPCCRGDSITDQNCDRILNWWSNWQTATEKMSKTKALETMSTSEAIVNPSHRHVYRDTDSLSGRSTIAPPPRRAKKHKIMPTAKDFGKAFRHIRHLNALIVNECQSLDSPLRVLCKELETVNNKILAAQRELAFTKRRFTL